MQSGFSLFENTLDTPVGTHGVRYYTAPKSGLDLLSPVKRRIRKLLYTQHKPASLLKGLQVQGYYFSRLLLLLRWLNKRIPTVGAYCIRPDFGEQPFAPAICIIIHRSNTQAITELSAS